MGWAGGKTVLSVESDTLEIGGRTKTQRGGVAGNETELGKRKETETGESTSAMKKNIGGISQFSSLGRERNTQGSIHGRLWPSDIGWPK